MNVTAVCVKTDKNGLFSGGTFVLRGGSINPSLQAHRLFRDHMNSMIWYNFNSPPNTST